MLKGNTTFLINLLERLLVLPNWLVYRNFPFLKQYQRPLSLKKYASRSTDFNKVVAGIFWIFLFLIISRIKSIL